MRGLGTVDVADADTAFRAEAPKPARPGAKRSFVERGAHSARPKDSDQLEQRAAAAIELALQRSRMQVERHRTSTTLAALAQVLESADATEDAVAAAAEALQLCSRSTVGALTDPTSARISLEVLIRLDKIDQALACAHALPLSSYATLMLGAALTSRGRFEDARPLIESVEGEVRDPVMAFLYISEGNYTAAVPLLRAALRRAPDDADSAHNLSIALWHIGSHRKAKSAALQATRSAPGREDISLNYLELLLGEGDFARCESEVEAILQRGVSPTPALLIIRARAQAGMNDLVKAERLLGRAGELARAEGDMDSLALALSNVARLRFVQGKEDKEVTLDRLSRLHDEFPSSDTVIANLAQISTRKKHAGPLRRAFDDVRDETAPARAAFVEYQLATLEGRNESAADWAAEWVAYEPTSAHATSAAIVALGIGMERWQEAAEISLRILDEGELDLTRLNNVAYVLAMSGMADRAIELLTPHAEENPILKATLGLAHLAAGQVDTGMMMYRRAADAADEGGDGLRALMTAYQAVIVRQLRLLESNDLQMISSVSLPPVALPDDWEDRPEFLRLCNVARRSGYGWPISI